MFELSGPRLALTTHVTSLGSAEVHPEVRSPVQGLHEGAWEASEGMGQREERKQGSSHRERPREGGFGLP